MSINSFIMFFSKNNSFINNTAQKGDGGAFNFHQIIGKLLFFDTLITYNQANSYGGVIFINGIIEYINDIYIKNSIIIGNSANIGGVFYMLNNLAYISSSVLMSNIAYITSSLYLESEVVLYLRANSFINEISDERSFIYLYIYIKYYLFYKLSVYQQSGYVLYIWGI